MDDRMPDTWYQISEKRALPKEFGAAKDAVMGLSDLYTEAAARSVVPESHKIGKGSKPTHAYVRQPKGILASVFTVGI